MTKEQIENIAKYATDSYFSNMPENDKFTLMAEPKKYIETYTRVYMHALDDVTKTIEQQQTKEELGTQFK